MICLLHCIFNGEEPPPPECEDRIRIVASGMLGVAVRDIVEQDRIPDAARLIAYGQVIAAFHRTRAVIPLRFGCVVEGDSGAIRLLQEHRQEYESLLDRLQGKSEMGVRLLSPRRAGECCRSAQEAVGAGPGAAYVSALRRRYSAQSLQKQEEELAAAISNAVDGLTKRPKCEVSEIDGTRLVSLHFLVNKEQIDLFREQVLRVPRPVDTRLMVSGPWPAYNFV